MSRYRFWLAVSAIFADTRSQCGSADACRNAAYHIVMGNEVRGVRQDVVDAADQALEIPQYGTKHSMNVSVTAGIVMWEFARQLRR